MTRDEQIETLDVFIESADELGKSSFLKQASDGGISTSIFSSDGRILAFDRLGPDHEAVRALLLTIRFFRQNNETSISNIAAMLSSLPVAEELRSQFTTSREHFNAYLDGPPAITFPEGIGAETNRAIFDTFLYGRFAHANRDKRRRVKKWERQPYFDDLRATFDRVLVEFVKAVWIMSKTCQQIRDQIAT